MTAPAQPSPLQTLRVGDVEVTFLPDGEAHFVPTGMFPASYPEAWEAHERWLDDDGRYVTTLGAFLIRTGDRNVIVDLGLGADVEMEIPDFVWARSGRLMESLGRAGCSAADVDTVPYTHVDADLARRTREKLLDELEATDVPVGCGHFPEAVFGRVLTGQGKRYWQPTP